MFRCYTSYHNLMSYQTSIISFQEEIRHTVNVWYTKNYHVSESHMYFNHDNFKSTQRKYRQQKITRRKLLHPKSTRKWIYIVMKSIKDQASGLANFILLNKILIDCVLIKCDSLASYLFKKNIARWNSCKAPQGYNIIYNIIIPVWCLIYSNCPGKNHWYRCLPRMLCVIQTVWLIIINRLFLDKTLQNSVIQRGILTDIYI